MLQKDRTNNTPNHSIFFFWNTHKPHQVSQSALDRSWNLHQQVDRSLGFVLPDIVSAREARDAVIGLTAPGMKIEIPKKALAPNQNKPWTLCLGHKQKQKMIFARLETSKEATECSRDTPVRLRNSNWCTRLKQFGLRLTELLSVHPGTISLDHVQTCFYKSWPLFVSTTCELLAGTIVVQIVRKDLGMLLAPLTIF